MMLYVYSIGVPVVLAAVLIFIYYLRSRNQAVIERKRKATSATDEKKDVIPARKLNKKYLSIFFDTKTGRWFNHVVLTPEIVTEIEKTWRSIGMEFSVFGSKEYMVNRYATYDKDNNETIRYRPVQILLSSTQKTPTELYNVLMQQWVTQALPLTVKQSTLQKLMPVLIWSGVLLFIGFAWANS